MSIKPFKQTSWDVVECQGCKTIIEDNMTGWRIENCLKAGHPLIRRQNIPFQEVIIIERLCHKGWYSAKGESGVRYMLSPTQFENVVKNCKMVCGAITDERWAFCKQGSSLSLRLVR